MNHFINKDKIIRKLTTKNELKRKILKFEQQTDISSNIRLLQIQLKLSKLTKKSSKTRICNRCIITGRKHSVYKKFKISRLILRKFMGLNIIPGLRKASW